MNVRGTAFVFVVCILCGVGCATSEPDEVIQRRWNEDLLPAERERVESFLRDHVEAESRDGYYPIPLCPDRPAARGEFVGFGDVYRRSRDVIYAQVVFDDLDEDRTYGLSFFLDESDDELSIKRRMSPKGEECSGE